MDNLECPFMPDDPSAGSRAVPFSRELFIEREDFLEDPPKKFFRLAPGREVRLRYAYFIRCEEVVKDPQTGEITELLCAVDPETRGGDAPDGRKVKATLHWVSAAHSLPAEVRLYSDLLAESGEDEDEDFTSRLNPDSLKVLKDCRVEPGIKDCQPESVWQFERLGYYTADRKDHVAGSRLVFNRTVTLKDAWAKEQKKA